MGDRAWACRGETLHLAGRRWQYMVACLTGLTVSAALSLALRSREFEQVSDDCVWAAKDVSLAEFRVLTTPLLKRRPSIRSLQWVHMCDTGQIVLAPTRLLSREINVACKGIFPPVYQRNAPLIVAALMTWSPWSVAAALILFVILVAYIVGLTAQNIKIRQQARQLACDLERETRDRKLAESTLYTSQTRWKTLYDSASDAIMVLTPEMKLFAGNCASIALFGCKEEKELVGCTPWGLSPEYQPDGVRSEIKAKQMVDIAMRQGTHSFEWKHKRKSGVDFLATVTLTRMELEGSCVLQAAVRDITERNLMEKMLQASERHYRLLAENLSDVVWSMDPSGRYTYISHTVWQQQGYTPEEILQGPVDQYLTPSSAALVRNHIGTIVAAAKAGQRTKTGNLDIEIRRKDGSTFWGEMTFTGMYDEMDELVAIQGTTRDITEQRRVEQAIRASEIKYRTLYDASSDAIMLRTPDRRIVSANRAAVKLFGCNDESELVSLDPADIYAEYQPDGTLSSEKAPEMVATALRGGSYSFEWKYRRQDGAEFLANVLWTRMELEGQTILLSTIRDITEQRRGEEALQASQAKYKALFDGAGDAIMLRRLDMTVIAANRVAITLFRVKDEAELSVGMPLAFSPEYQPDGTRSSDKAKQVGAIVVRDGVTQFEWKYRRKDGTEFLANVLLTKIQLKDDCIVQMTVRDITEQRRAEERRATSLRRLEGVNRLQEDLLLPGLLAEKFTRITEAAVTLLDLDFCRIWLVQPGDICQTGCMHGGTASRALCPLQDKCLHLLASSGRYTHLDGGHRRVPLGAFKIGRIASGEKARFVTNDVTTDPEVGDHQWTKDLGLVSFAGYKLRDADGQPTGVLAMFAKHPLSEEDDAFIAALAETTSRVILDDRVAEELRQSQAQAIEANQAKSQFLASMSHEIRTPMTAILGYADQLMDPKVNASTQNNYAAVIRRNGEHLLTLINDILDLSKIEAGKLAIDMRRCSVVSLLTDVASAVRPRAVQHGVSLAVEFPGEMPETIFTDSNRLRQAIINLAGNAVKFTKRGSVRIVASFIATWRHGRPAVRIEVIDTGIGIREDILPQLFQPFSQGDASVSRKFGGTGLGLAISRQIARMLDGDLTVASISGQGSTFTLTVPTGNLDGIAMLARPAEMALDIARNASLPSSTTLEGVRVLLAEDGYDNRRLIEMVLRTVGAKVESVENGRLAVAKAEAEQFDIILMDINMPEMDGFEATQLLRSRGYDRPILALTANAMAGDSEKCCEAGCNEHLSKPIDRAQLIRTVASFAGRQTDEQQQLVCVRSVDTTH